MEHTRCRQRPGSLAEMAPAELLACGTANSGFYVRNGRSATSRELCRFLETWAAGKIKE